MPPTPHTILIPGCISDAGVSTIRQSLCEILDPKMGPNKVGMCRAVGASGRGVLCAAGKAKGRELPTSREASRGLLTGFWEVGCAGP